MTIVLNGKSREFAAPRFESVDDLLKELNLAGHPVLIELNGKALLKQEISQYEINEGDHVEIVRMVAGG